MLPYFIIFGFTSILIASWLRKTDKYEDVCVATFIGAFLLVLTPLAFVEGYLRPVTLDARLRAIDLWLGLDGFALTRLWLRTPWLHSLLTYVYEGLPCVFAVNWIVERSRTFLRNATIAAFMAFPIYLLIPACGPQYAFSGFPLSDASAMAFVPTGFARNCMPSMHYSWALLLALNAKNRRWRVVLFIYAHLVAIAAVAVGEHYFIDMIAAVPFTFAVQYFAKFCAVPSAVHRDETPASVFVFHARTGRE